MAENLNPQHQQSKLVQGLVEAGKKAFDPALDATSRGTGIKEYNELVERTETWVLLHALNPLIRPNVLPPWLSQAFMQTLTLLPLRPDGVRGTLEFVFSVHPSNSSRISDSTTPQRQGASITHEAVAMATKLLSSVPSSMTPQAWFEGISSQIYRLMDGMDGSELSRTSAQIVGFGILGKKQLGAPGAPGWAVFVQPLLETINPSLRQTPEAIPGGDQDEVIDLSRDQVLVTSESLEVALRRIKVLILSNPSPGLCRRLLKPVLAQIWALASWSSLPSGEGSPRSAAKALLETYLRLFGNSETVAVLVKNALCRGSLPEGDTPWEYRPAQNGMVDIVAKRSGATSQDVNWGEVEKRAVVLADTIVTACSEKDVSALFLDLLRRWIKTSAEPPGVGLPTSTTEDEKGPGSALQDLFEVTLLQKLLEKAPEKLISRFDQLLELIVQVLQADGQAALADDLVGVVLSLLNMVVTAPTFNKSSIGQELLSIIKASLNRLSKEDRGQTSQTASNLALLLKYRGDLDQDEEATPTLSSRQIEDRRTYNLAMNYITGTDNPPPVVSEGLNLLSGLILAGSPALDVTAVNVLMCNLLTNNEDYINLRVVKIFTQLANKHPKSTTKELLDHYLDAQEKASTDTRLRFGEALLQVIERLGETFNGDVARQVGETLLSVAGRRGYRPKAQAKQAREERLRELKKKKGEVQDDDEDMVEHEEMTEDEKATNDILAKIVQGWDSKRGAEDIRMRTSALSIFGTALETNIGGLGPTLASGGVDLCINILTLEPELEKGILRRAAIIAVLGFVRALQKAKETGRSLGFGLADSSREDILRTLQYIAGTDNDGLVQQHAHDVVESLENWQMSSLLSAAQATEGSGLGRLAGLSVNPEGNLLDPSGRPRPRIEEVE